MPEYNLLDVAVGRGRAGRKDRWEGQVREGGTGEDNVQ